MNSMQVKLTYDFDTLALQARPTLLSSGESSWLQIQRSRDGFWELVGLERGPLVFVRITEELLEWKIKGSGLENQD
jgi:hypothetical protein